MSQLPSMPFFCDAYIADTRDLTLEERGLYSDLLFFMWANGGRIADDDEKISRRLGITVRRFRALRPQIDPFLERYGNEANGWFLTQKRLQKEWNRVQDKLSKQSEKGKRSGQSRREKAAILRTISRTMDEPRLNNGSTPDEPMNAGGSNRMRTSKPNIDITSTFLQVAEAESSDPDLAIPPFLDRRPKAEPSGVSRLLNTDLMKRSA